MNDQERLTFDGLFCDIAVCLETPGGSFCENGMCSQRKVWERLKAYEDTGLTPEEIRARTAECVFTNAPVVHGRWLCGQTVAWHTRYSCSVCGRAIEICVEDKKDGLHQYPYCHCGAKMDGGDNP